MEECSFVDEIKTETPVDDTKSEILTEKRRVSIKNELLDDEEQTSKKNRDYDQAGEDRQYVEIEECDEIIPNDRLKKELENSSKAEPSGCGNKGISAPCSIKREYDCDFNEEIEIKNDSDVEHIITSENSSQSCSDDEHSDQSEEGMEDGTYTLENEEVIEDKLDELKKVERKEHIGRNVDKLLNEFKCNSCDYMSKYKSHLDNHKKRVHLKEMYKCNDKDFSIRKNSNLGVQRENNNSNVIASIFECNSCDYFTNYRFNLKHHIELVHLKNKKYKCDNCDFSTTRRNDLVGHRKNKHPNEIASIFECDTCHYITKHKLNLKLHIERIHLRNKKYKCDDCDFSTTQRCYLVSHKKNKHHREAAAKLKCDSCDYITFFKSGLQKHIEGVHLKNKIYKCDKCDYSATQRRYLVDHRKNKHRDGIAAIFKYKCDNCDYSTTRRNYLVNHIKYKHSNEMAAIFKCASCNYVSKLKGNLRRHIERVHLNIKKYKCDGCDYTTTRMSYLVDHRKKERCNEIGAMLKYKCDKCDFSTAQKSFLIAHIKSQHPNEISPIFKCDSCDFITKYRGNLNLHVKHIHLEDKRYKCSDCDYSTVRRTYLVAHRKNKHCNEVTKLNCDGYTIKKLRLNEHIRLVHIKKKYECKDCDYSTACKHDLTTHRAIKHLNEIITELYCNLCDFTTKYKADLKRHIESVHF